MSEISYEMLHRVDSGYSRQQFMVTFSDATCLKFKPFYSVSKVQIFITFSSSQNTGNIE